MQWNGASLTPDDGMAEESSARPRRTTHCAAADSMTPNTAVCAPPKASTIPKHDAYESHEFVMLGNMSAMSAQETIGSEGYDIPEGETRCTDPRERTLELSIVSLCLQHCSVDIDDLAGFDIVYGGSASIFRHGLSTKYSLKQRHPSDMQNKSCRRR